MKQLALGVLMYVQDYDEKMPGRNAALACSNDADWSAMIYPYIKSTQVFECPSVNDSVGQPVRRHPTRAYWTTRSMRISVVVCLPHWRTSSRYRIA